MMGAGRIHVDVTAVLGTASRSEDYLFGMCYIPVFLVLGPARCAECMPGVLLRDSRGESKDEVANYGWWMYSCAMCRLMGKKVSFSRHL